METFNEPLLEHTLLKLKDTQDSIASVSNWCIRNQRFHEEIVDVWLDVLKRVKVEQRVVLFYLANDVVQYSKKKSLPFVDSFAPAFVKAVTMVREEVVRPKMERLFSIWKQRGIYDEKFLVALNGSLTRDKTSRIDFTDFQPSVLHLKLRSCKELEDDTDLKLKILTQNHISLANIQKMKTFKQRDTGTDLIPEVEGGLKKFKEYISALEAKFKERVNLLDLLDFAEIYYADQLKEAQVVEKAYEDFSVRIKGVKRKLEERIKELPSPRLSPDVNAPSPSSSSLPDKSGLNELSFCGMNFSSGGSFMDGSLLANLTKALHEETTSKGNKVEVVTRSQTLNDQNMTLSALLQSLIPFTGAADTENQVNETSLLQTPRSPSPEFATPHHMLSTKYPIRTESGDIIGHVRDIQCDSPESSPWYEKTGYSLTKDVDMRSVYDGDNTLGDERIGKDMDHRNLISLTGNYDTDFRPITSINRSNPQDNVENIDMDLSDDEKNDNQQHKIPLIVKNTIVHTSKIQMTPVKETEIVHNTNTNKNNNNYYCGNRVLIQMETTNTTSIVTTPTIPPPTLATTIPPPLHPPTPPPPQPPPIPFNYHTAGSYHHHHHHCGPHHQQQHSHLHLLPPPSPVIPQYPPYFSVRHYYHNPYHRHHQQQPPFRHQRYYQHRSTHYPKW